jgi:hypothetical protein
MLEILSVKDYIKKHYPSQAEFARVHRVSPQRITEFINSGFIFVGDDMYSHRRHFERPGE